jgi:flagellar basal body-associated protein FliL
MVSVAFEVENNELRDHLHRREAHVRDIVISVLEDQTMAALSRPGARDSVKVRLASAIRPLIDNTSVTVYLPQFVIN